MSSKFLSFFFFPLVFTEYSAKLVVTKQKQFKRPWIIFAETFESSVNIKYNKYKNIILTVKKSPTISSEQYDHFCRFPILTALKSFVFACFTTHCIYTINIQLNVVVIQKRFRAVLSKNWNAKLHYYIFFVAEFFLINFTRVIYK